MSLGESRHGEVSDPFCGEGTGPEPATGWSQSVRQTDSVREIRWKHSKLHYKTPTDPERLMSCARIMQSIEEPLYPDRP